MDKCNKIIGNRLINSFVIEKSTRGTQIFQIKTERKSFMNFYMLEHVREYKTLRAKSSIQMRPRTE